MTDVEVSARREDGQSLVSVCVPAYMAEAYLAATIDSVLAQTHQHWELLILDNNSSERTGEIARSFTDPRVTVQRNRTTLSMADNWNAAVALSTAQYVKLLCADDLLDPDCLTEELAVLAADCNLALVAGRRHFIDATGEVVLRDRGLVGLTGRRESQPAVQAVVKSGINPIGCPSAMMFRRDAFTSAGGFESHWDYTLDLDLAFRLLEHGDFYGIERSLSSFRISPTSASSVMASFGAQHRSMLRTVAANPKWRVSFYTLSRGMFFSKIESVRKWLLYRAFNSPHRTLRRLPGMMLQGISRHD